MIAAVLTGFMILLFLRSWRSTLTVCISIPLSIPTSLIVLCLSGQTINVMTLGGLGLAVGILVDDATVTIENIHRNLQQKKPLTRAILDGTRQIAVPAFVSTLSICIVFVPVLLLTGPARYLFTALAMSVVFAMLASYLLSRTLVPAMVHYLCANEVEIYAKGEDHVQVAGVVWRVHHAFNGWFERARARYMDALAWTLGHRKLAGGAFVLFVIASLPLALFVGEDFFPTVDSGQMRLHVRTPPGTRIEETERIFAQVEDEIRRELGGELSNILDSISLPVSGVNMALSDSATIGSGDGEILISLREGDHTPTEEWISRLRRTLPKKFPDLVFFFQPANITNQILNFGLPAPVDIQVVGRNAEANYQIARRIKSRLERVPGAADVHIHQEVNYPEFRVKVDRAKASQVGLTQRDIANSLLISLSSSGQVAPNQWLNPVNGVNYQVSVQTPQYRVDSFDELARTPIAAPGGAPQLPSNLATFGRGSSTALVSHYNVQPVFDVYANVDRTDLGTLAPIEVKRAQAEVARSRQDLTNAESLLMQQELVIKKALTRNGMTDQRLRGLRLVPPDRIEIPPRDDVRPIEELVAEAYRNRPDLEQARLQISNSEISLKASKNALLPSLDVVAGLQNKAMAGQSNLLGAAAGVDPFYLGGAGTLLSQLIARNFPNYSVGYQLNIPLRNRAAQADLVRDQLEIRQSEVRLHNIEQQVRLEIESALIALDRARTASQAAVETRQL